MLIASIAFLPIFLKYYHEVNLGNIKFLAIVGIIGTVLPTYLYAIAQTQVNSSVAAVLNSMTPIFTLLLGSLFFNTKMTRPKILGVTLGFAGAAILILFGKETGIKGNILYGFFIILATMFYAISGNTVSAYLKETSTYTISSSTIVFLGIPSLLYLISTDFIHKMQYHEDALFSFVAIMLLAIVSTVVGAILFFRLVQQTSAVFGSTVAYLIPIVAIILGAFDGESISMFHYIGVVLILGGVYLSGR